MTRVKVQHNRRPASCDDIDIQLIQSIPGQSSMFPFWCHYILITHVLIVWLNAIQVSLLKGLSASSWVWPCIEPCFQGLLLCVSLRPIQTWLATSRAFWKMVVFCSSSWPWLRLFHLAFSSKVGNRTAYCHMVKCCAQLILIQYEFKGIWLFDLQHALHSHYL